MWFVALELLDRARTATHRGRVSWNIRGVSSRRDHETHRQSNRIDKSERREIVGRVPGTS
jgi:hypothetical protein